MAIRKSGSTQINCVWRDRENHYKCALSVQGKRRGVQYVGAPRHLTESVDAPAAYTAAARAAISFALNEGMLDESDVAWGEDGPRISVGRR
jgi:hypothetical protein